MLSTKSKGNLEGLSVVAVHDQDDLCFGVGGDTVTGQISFANLGAIDVCNCLTAFQRLLQGCEVIVQFFQTLIVKGG